MKDIVGRLDDEEFYTVDSVTGTISIDKAEGKEGDAYGPWEEERRE